MTVQELIARFPEIPPSLHDEPLLAELAATCGELLSVAHKPEPCSTAHDAGTHFYLAIIGPIAYYGYGLATRERVLQDIRELLDRYREDPSGFTADLLAEEATSEEP